MHVVIVGTGQAGFQAASSLRQAGFEGQVTLVGRESEPPYQRPPLSKEWLQGDDGPSAVHFRPETFFASKDIALVSGEAGIGKTSFVDRFLGTRGRGMQVLKGNCDALFTPTPLGPLYDIARQSDGPLLSQLESDTSHGTVFSTMVDRLRRSARPVLLVIEDIHWADEATLDLIVFLSRRIAQAKVLFILTYRDDEVGSKHPLRVLLGDLAMLRTVVRIELPRLTVEAVRTLIADRPIDPASLHGRTSGNPFYVTEVLANAGRGIPKTVRDAVLARAARLSAAGRHVLEAATVIGGRIEHGVVDKILGAEAEGLAECMKFGMLEAAEIGVTFRHALVLRPTDADTAARLCDSLMNSRHGPEGAFIDQAHALATAIQARHPMTPELADRLQTAFVRTGDYDALARLGSFDGLTRAWAENGTVSRAGPPSRSTTGRPAALPWMSRQATSKGENTRSVAALCPMSPDAIVVSGAAMAWTRR